MIQANCLLNLGADAEVKTINDRQYIAFRGASTERRGDQQETTWISVLASPNDNLLPYLRKGQQVFVSGRMTARIYQSQQSFGIDITIFANTLQLCGGKRDDHASAPQLEDTASPTPPTPPTDPTTPTPAPADDLPF